MIPTDPCDQNAQSFAGQHPPLLGIWARAHFETTKQSDFFHNKSTKKQQMCLSCYFHIFHIPTKLAVEHTADPSFCLPFQRITNESTDLWCGQFPTEHPISTHSWSNACRRMPILMLETVATTTATKSDKVSKITLNRRSKPKQAGLWIWTSSMIQNFAAQVCQEGSMAMAWLKNFLEMRPSQ